jgi:hypothetical protein
MYDQLIPNRTEAAAEIAYDELRDDWKFSGAQRRGEPFSTTVLRYFEAVAAETFLEVRGLEAFI